MTDERTLLEIEYGQVWDTKELTVDFTVEDFLAPIVVCVNKKTGKRGTMMFQHCPRYYFNWMPD